MVAEFKDQCKAPNVNGLVGAVTQGMLDAALDFLGLGDLPTPDVGDIVDDVLGNTLGGVTGALPRADLGKGYQRPQPIDPFGLAAHGLDPGLGTLLLQGVAEVR